MFKYHVTALLLGTILEFFIGRLYSIWNPFDSIKNLVAYLDRALLGDEIIVLEPAKRKNLGLWILVIVLVPVIVFIGFYTIIAYEVAPVIGVIFEAIASYFCLDGHRLFYIGKEAMEDFYSDGIPAMRRSVGVLTGHDSDNDNEQTLTKEAVTYIANESSDSVISPIFVMFLFGPVGGFIYRTVDIMDSVIGYDNDRYRDFGYYTACLDRIFDYIPGRFSGWLATFLAKFTSDCNAKNASYIHLRDRKKAISAFSGALEISLKNDSIGDDDRVANARQINTAVRLMRNMYITCQLAIFIMIIVC